MNLFRPYTESPLNQKTFFKLFFLFCFNFSQLFYCEKKHAGKAKCRNTSKKKFKGKTKCAAKVKRRSIMRMTVHLHIICSQLKNTFRQYIRLTFKIETNN